MSSTQTRVRRRLARLIDSSDRPAAKTPKPVGPEGIPGRLLRDVPAVEATGVELDAEGTDAAEAAAVRAGWLLLDAHERLSKLGATRVFGHETEAWHAYAEDTIGHLNYTLSDGQKLVPENRKNRLRFRRTLDFAREGETVFDVGFGRGLLAAQLVMDRGVRRYHGIDIVDRYVPMATDLFHVNGLAPEALNLSVKDLYELNRDDIESTGAKLVICCEVLEHVPDAELALKTLAEALPVGADLLFSVPMHGRIEGAWGHVSVFDVARLKGMLDFAGLTAHHVEPLANAWSLIVASRDSGGSQRVREATGRPATRVSRPLSSSRDFVYLRSDAVSAVGAASLVPKTSQTMICKLGSGDGVSFGVDGVTALRLRFAITDASHLTRFVTKAYAGDEQVASWTWKIKRGTLRPGRVLSTVMRPGEVGLEFVGGPHAGLDRADRVEVVATVDEGHVADFTFRVAYLP